MLNFSTCLQITHPITCIVLQDVFSNEVRQYEAPVEGRIFRFGTEKVKLRI